jgi:TolB-like protein/tRNA A-37 threonylcarbamoyl transferase component Bud32
VIGRELNQYRILSRLGKGAMGEVYLAQDTQLDRKVALKILPPEMADSPQRVERFKREARAVAALSHPNIVTIHSVEETRGLHFLTMELVSGKTLDALIPNEGLALERIFEVAIPLADALSEAHAKGITHRDLKPANVMVTDDGRVKVLDFGLAKFRESAKGEDERLPTRTLTQEGTLVGTMPYMSPEQIKSATVDHRSDIFSLGVILYEMATGKRPFGGESSAELISSLLRDDPPSVSDVNTSVPRHLGRIIRLCLEKDPAQRYQSAADVRNELRALRTEVASGVIEERPHPRAPRGRPGTLVALGVVALVGIAILIAWGLRSRTKLAAPERAQVSIAVLPFRNMSGDTALAFLSLAVPDEVTTTLSRAQGLSLRPFSGATRYTGDDIDVPAAGRELHATTVVTGQFFRQGSDLRLTLEAVDVSKNEIVWRDGVNARADDLIALRGQVSDRIRTGLVPRLTGANAGTGAGTQPSNPEAYDLYLRSLAISPDLVPNRESIRMLERAVELDPSFAPAWAELGERYSFEAAYGEGGDAFYPKAMDALRRALALDPNLQQPAGWLLQLEVESGHLEQGYDTARALLERFPRSAALHFSMSYVLRYAGLFDEAARECNTAYGLDSTDPAMRSCGVTFYMLGDYERSELFFKLSDDSQFSVIQRWISLMRQRRDREALAMIERFQGAPVRAFGVRCLEGAKPDELAALAVPFAAFTSGQRDGEGQYLYGGIFARCGERRLALEHLARAVEHNYCASPQIESDPLLEGLRGDPELEKIVAAARACRQRFEQHRR